MGNTVLSPFALWDKVTSLELSRSFIQSILWEAYDRDDQYQVEEFSAKLEAVNKEISKLIAEV